MSSKVHRLKLKHTRSAASHVAQQLNIGEGSPCWVQINGAQPSIRARLVDELRQLVPNATAVAVSTRAKLERSYRISTVNEADLREFTRRAHHLNHPLLPVALVLVAEVERQVDCVLRHRLGHVIQQLHKWVKEVMVGPVLNAFATYYGAGDAMQQAVTKGIVEPELHRQLDRLLPCYIKMNIAQGKRCVHECVSPPGSEALENLHASPVLGARKGLRYPYVDR